MSKPIVQVSIAMAIFTILFVPETRGKTLQEIQALFGELPSDKPPHIETISEDVEREK